MFARKIEEAIEKPQKSPQEIDLEYRLKQKWSFPLVKIHGMAISCGLCALQWGSAMTYYYLGGNAPKGPYSSVSEVIFGMTFFSKFKTLHHRNALQSWTEGLGGLDLFSPNPTNLRHHILERKFGYVMSHYNTTLNEIEQFIKKHNLGVTYRTPDFKNKKYSAEGGSTVGVLVWHWNGNVPPIENAPKGFPFDINGNLLPGMTNEA